MNVSSAASAALLFSKDSGTPNANAAPGAASPKSALASLLDNHATSFNSKASGSDKRTTPQQDVAKKLKALGEQFLAVMLIADPVARAKAAAGLYKQFAETGKEYAKATSDGGAAAAQATFSSPAAAAAFAGAGEPAAAAADPSAVDPTTGAIAAEAPTAPTAPAPSPTAAPVTADGAEATAPVGPLPGTEAASAPAAPAVTYTMSGKKPAFAGDLYMEQIKDFAKIAEQVYKAAIEEARQKHADKKHKLDGLDDKMKDAKETLTDAAKAVEGPAATADGYDPVAKAFPPSDPPPVLNVTA